MVDSGQGVTTQEGIQVSGAVQISGTVAISGEIARVVSGAVVVDSGVHIITDIPDTVVIRSGATTWANPRVLGQSSGYVQTAYALHGFASGAVQSVTVRAHPSNSGDLYIGGHAVPNLPTSGVGMLLQPGDSLSFDIDNLHKVWGVAEVSGDSAFFIGVN